jgi:hypothetical protein
MGGLEGTSSELTPPPQEDRLKHKKSDMAKGGLMVILFNSL